MGYMFQRENRRAERLARNNAEECVRGRRHELDQGVALIIDGMRHLMEARGVMNQMDRDRLSDICTHTGEFAADTVGELAGILSRQGLDPIAASIDLTEMYAFAADLN